MQRIRWVKDFARLSIIGPDTTHVRRHEAASEGLTWAGPNETETEREVASAFALAIHVRSRGLRARCWGI